MRSDVRLDQLSARVSDEVPERLAERREWCAKSFGATAGQHDGAVGMDAAAELGADPCLADPRLPRDERRSPERVVEGRCARRRELGQLHAAAHKAEALRTPEASRQRYGTLLPASVRRISRRHASTVEAEDPLGPIEIPEVVPSEVRELEVAGEPVDDEIG